MIDNPSSETIAESRQGRGSTVQCVEDTRVDIQHMTAVTIPDAERTLNKAKSTNATSKSAYVPPAVVTFWLGMWFFQNVSVTFWNKKALTTLHLPITLTFVHMICNSIGSFVYVYVFRAIERKKITSAQHILMINFSFVFVSNIITGNWSLGVSSISFNQIMRALVPSVVVGLSMVILGRSYSSRRKASLIPVAYGVYLACSGDNTTTLFGVFITLTAVMFAGLKAVLSSKFLTGDLRLHPVDLILHQAPLSACWCFICMWLTGEMSVLQSRLDELPRLCVWYIITGVISFLLNITSFYANQVTSPVTLCVCGNIKQVFVIMLSLMINSEPVSIKKLVGILMVSIGGGLYAHVSFKEMHDTLIDIRVDVADKARSIKT